MTKQSFRVKPYSHRDYKFVVRVKVDGKWLRRYFRTENEAVAFADKQNAALQNPEAIRAPALRRAPNAVGPAPESGVALTGAPDLPKPSGQPISEVLRQNVPDDSLPWTGERLVTTCQRPLAFEHLHRYGVACALAGGKRVLDIACGEGYGANLLADFAQEVVGIDKDPATMAHAKRKYQRPNLRFMEGDCTALPLADDSIDLVASFETIEHISAHQRFLDEIKRVLAPGGVLVISSPDKTEYANISQSANPFHQAELTHEEFGQLVRRMFKHCVIGKQRLVVGSWIAPDGADSLAAASTFHGGFNRIGIESGVHRGLYSVAICSDAELPTVKLGMFENHRDSNETWDLFDLYESPANVAMRISELQRENETKNEELAQLNRENETKSEELAQLTRETDKKSNEVATLQQQNDGLSRQIRRLEESHRHQQDQLTHSSSELLDARWELLSLRAESIRGNEAATEAVSRFTEMENQANTATSERDQLRQLVVGMLQDLEQERLNVSAMENQLRFAQEHAAADADEMERLREQVTRLEEKMTAAEVRFTADASRWQELDEQSNATHDRLLNAQENLRNAENRAAATLDELQTTQAQAQIAQEHLHATAKELAARRKQLSLLRERLRHRLILPVGKAQQELEELTR